jgi:hypothetical protein
MYFSSIQFNFIAYQDNVDQFNKELANDLMDIDGKYCVFVLYD